MANKSWVVLSLVLCVAVAVAVAVVSASDPGLQLIFVLGDSTADVGTNNFLPTSMVRADFPHNGIDFPSSKPTGRFSNGLNSADFLAQMLGLKRSPPPFLSLNAKSLRKKRFSGVNFASGGSGLLDITGNTSLTLMKFGTPVKTPVVAPSGNRQNVVSLTEQIQQFATVKRNLTAIKGGRRVTEKSLFFISTGSNDLFGYYHSNSSIPKEEFLSSLELAYENHLKSLIDLGARKFGIISVAPIGCCPSQRIHNTTGGCLEGLNELAVAFHARLDALMLKLGSECKDIKYALGNAFEMTVNVIQNPFPFNFTQLEAACCGAGKLNAESFCIPSAKLCSNRNNYLFWDLFHPTQAASKLAAVTLFNGGTQFVTPINFAQLAKA
ncbi:hypothetical protein COP1_003457 [Malus domestica]